MKAIKPMLDNFKNDPQRRVGPPANTGLVGPPGPQGPQGPPGPKGDSAPLPSGKISKIFFFYKNHTFWQEFYLKSYLDFYPHVISGNFWMENFHSQT